MDLCLSNEHDDTKIVTNTVMIPISSTNWLPKNENHNGHQIIHEHGKLQIDTLNDQWQDVR